jgi:hypothetical protein
LGSKFMMDVGFVCNKATMLREDNFCTTSASQLKSFQV